MKSRSGKLFCISPGKHWYVFLAESGNVSLSLWWPHEQKEWLENCLGWMEAKICWLVVLSEFLSTQVRMIYFKTSQGRIRQTRDMHTSITRMTNSGKIVDFLL